jgi:hypothetical protein
VEYQRIAQDQKRSGDAHLLANEFAQEALALLVPMAELLSPPKAWGARSALSGKETGTAGEARAHTTLKRLARQLQHRNWDKSETNASTVVRTPESIPSLNDLLTRTIEVTWDIVEFDIIKVARVFATPKIENQGILPGDGQGLEAVEIAPKYRLIFDTLLQRGVNPLDIAIVQEELDRDQMRKIPYRILYVRLPAQESREARIVTICVSDQIGERTYLYNGYVDLWVLSHAKKWENIHWINCTGITYGEYFVERFVTALYGDTPPVHQRLEEKMPTNPFLHSSNLSEIIRYQSQLLAITPELKEKAGIIQEEGIWYFDDAKGVDNWPKIAGKKLMSFPNAAFIKEHTIENKYDQLLNPTHLSQIFTALWLRVATKEEYIALYRSQLLAITPELREIGIIQEEGIWYFDDAKGNDSWPKIAGKNLKRFPNATFIKEHTIENKYDQLLNPTHLSQIFTALWLRVATKEEYIARYRSQLLAITPELKEKAGIIQEEGIWYFDDALGANSWPNIAGRNLGSFPNAAFINEHSRENKSSVIINLTQLSQIFTALWLRVATPTGRRTKE